MYIRRMRTAGRLLAVLTVAALLSPWVPSVLCARPGKAAMPCCKTQAPCRSQMGANGCCSVERAPAAPGGSPGTPAPPAASGQAKRAQPVHADRLAADLSSGFDQARTERLWYPPAHDRSAPVFLRNVSILR